MTYNNQWMLLGDTDSAHSMIHNNGSLTLLTGGLGGVCAQVHRPGAPLRRSGAQVHRSGALAQVRRSGGPPRRATAQSAPSIEVGVSPQPRPHSAWGRKAAGRLHNSPLHCNGVSPRRAKGPWLPALVKPGWLMRWGLVRAKGPWLPALVSFPASVIPNGARGIDCMIPECDPLAQGEGFGSYVLVDTRCHSVSLRH